MSPDEQTHILKQRAELMAQPLKKEKATKGVLEILVFGLANEYYGLETIAIGEVHPLHDFTPLPGTPSFIFGLVNLRRKILTVIDLKPLFSLPQGVNTSRKIITLQSRQRSSGILADSIEGVRTVSLEQLEPPLPTLTGIKLEFIKGITADRVVVLDHQQLLSSPHLIVDQTVEFASG